MLEGQRQEEHKEILQLSQKSFSPGSMGISLKLFCIYTRSEPNSKYSINNVHWVSTAEKRRKAKMNSMRLESEVISINPWFQTYIQIHNYVAMQRLLYTCLFSSCLLKKPERKQAKKKKTPITMSTTVMEISISKYYPLIKPTKIPWKICKINQEYHVIPEIKGLLKKKKGMFVQRTQQPT